MSLITEEENSDDDEQELSPLITAWEASGQSRLTKEFDVLKSLGKGGFGDVIKVGITLYIKSYPPYNSLGGQRTV